MFRPRYNSQKDLEEWDEREQALAYDPEMGDVDTSAPVPKQVQASKYDPEMGDVDENSPATGDLVADATPMNDPRRVQALSEARVSAPDGTEPTVTKHPVQVARNEVASNVQHTPPKASRQDYGAKPPSRLQTILAQLGQMGAQAYAASRPGHPAVLAASQARGERAVQIGQEDQNERGRYAWRKGKMQAEQADNARADAREKRLMRREDAQDARLKSQDEAKAAKSRPDSPSNVKYREAVSMAYPDVVSKIPKEKWDTFTVEDGEAIGLITKRADKTADAEAEETIHQRRRGEKTEDFEKNERVRAKLRRPMITPWGYSPGGSESGADMDIMTTLTEQFGGVDKIPPALTKRAKLAQAIRNPKARYTAVEKVLASAQSEHNKSQGEEAKTAMADFKEQNAYAKSIDGVRDIDQSVDQFLKQSGLDLDKDPKTQKIPGVGPIEGLIPNQALALAGAAGIDSATQGLNNRMSGLEVVQARVLEMSGKAATDREKQEYKQIYALMTSGSEEQLILGLRRLKEINARRLDDASRNFPKAAGAFNQTQANPPSTQTPAGQPSPAQPTAKTVKVRDPKNPQNVQDRPMTPTLQKFIDEGRLELVQ